MAAGEASAENTVAEFVGEFGAQVEGWTGLFKTLSKEAQRHKTALPGALKIKKAQQSLEAVDSSNVAETLLTCQEVMRQVILGLLDVTFAQEEEIVQKDYSDVEAAAAVNGTLDAVVMWADRLQRLFKEHDVQPAKQAVQTADTLPPEIAKMLEQQAKKEAKKNAKRGVVASEPPVVCDQAWADGEGRFSTLLDAEVWEVLCWRRGSFRHKCAYDAVHKEGRDPLGVLTVGLLQESVDALRKMRSAQGPLVAEHEQPDSWQAPAAEDETRVLLRHGVHSSTHLLAMKQQAELMFWQWKYFPTQEHLLAAERIQLEFIYLIEKVIPDRGWTAEWERGRLNELKNAEVPDAGAESEESTPSSTMEVLEEEFGSLDVQQEINRMKKEDQKKKKPN